MTHEDRLRWDARHAGRATPQADPVGLSPVLQPYGEVFPTAGLALDLACGAGAAGVWLACRGMTVVGLDVSAVAVEQAQALARANGVADRCRFEVVDLDDGIPPGPQFDAVVCQRFRDPRLDGDILDRLADGGTLAIDVLSEVGAGPGPFRARAGELTLTFGALTVVATGEGDGEAWLLARKMH